MKKLTRLLLLSFCTNFIGSAVCAAERSELSRAAVEVTASPSVVSHLATLAKSVSTVKVSERLVLTPRLAKGGASLRATLAF